MRFRKFLFTSVCIISLIILGLLAGVCMASNVVFGVRLEIDLSTILSALSIVATVIVLPLIVEKIVSNDKTRNELLSQQLFDIIDALRNLRKRFNSLSTESPITKQDWRNILGSLKEISFDLDCVADLFKNSSNEASFRKDIIDKEYISAYTSCTEWLTPSCIPTSSDISNTISSINQLIKKLISFRFSIYE